MLSGFAENLQQLLEKGERENVHLHVAHFLSPECNARAVLEEMLPDSMFSITDMEGEFSKVSALNALARGINSQELLLFIDVDLVIPEGFFNLVRRETLLGRQVTAPICFSLYKDKPEVVDHANGYWRTYGYGTLSIYKSDFLRVGGYDLSKFSTAWGGEDLDIIDRIIEHKYKVFRTQEVGLIHRWHPSAAWRDCEHMATEEERRDCFAVEVDQLGSKQDIAKMYVDALEHSCPEGVRAGSSASSLCPEVKIFVYPMPDEFTHRQLWATQHGAKSDCELSMFSSEIIIHRALLLSRYITFDASDADFFFVPVYGACFMKNNDPMDAASGAHFYQRAFQHVVRNYKYFNRTHGMDHVWAFSNPLGPRLFQQWTQVKNSLFLMPDGDLARAEFSPWKDIVIPPNVEHLVDSVWRSGGAVDEDEEREYTAMYAQREERCEEECGGMACCANGALRRAVRESVMLLADFLPTSMRGDMEGLRRNMRTSTFCIIADGWAGEFVQPTSAILSGCIPVLFSRNVVLPLADTLDYSQAIYFYDDTTDAGIHRLPEVLRGVPREVVARYRRAMADVAPALVYHTAVEAGDAVDTLTGILRHRHCHMNAVR
eukprot:TRINITY_DN13092_c0_g1_i1.p1 TRINITY_DN13092_c0_g1~~TRINITY_DN13092_c0_g1_i1.p1  ORF type:complete len:617 (+),score=178.97 TRINITY_DN13092_c0_g1_i1:48-1853(+)